MYLLRIKKIDIPLFLLIGHYNPFFPKTICPFVVIACFLFSPRSTGIVPFPSHVTQSLSHFPRTNILPAFRAGLFRGAQLHKFCYIHHESSLGRSQNSHKIGKIEVKLGNLEMRYNSMEFSNKLALAFLLFWGKYMSRHLTKVTDYLMRNR